MGKADRVERRRRRRPRRTAWPPSVPSRRRRTAGPACRARPTAAQASEQDAAVADAVAEHAERDLQDDVAEADHGQQQGGFGLANSRCGCHRPETARSRRSPPRRTPARRRWPSAPARCSGRSRPARRVAGMDLRAFAGGRRSTGMAASITTTKVTPNGRKPALPSWREQPRAEREAERQHGRVDAEHEAAPLAAAPTC